MTLRLVIACDHPSCDAEITATWPAPPEWEWHCIRNDEIVLDGIVEIGAADWTMPGPIWPGRGEGSMNTYCPAHGPARS